ncbi:olfactory receptor 2A12-like [Chanos chanos]|uniref:Olfactory receptor n=1 Tax=Chanos chanos TaxID=29144 RepID=A0A6J2WVB5_CHACN|nr:olfactory receptor 2A12-like [Chanos chanos]
MLHLRSSAHNNSIIHPSGFYIIGFTSLPYSSLYVIFLAVVYVITVLSNSFVISIISFDERLHRPKFLAVGNLAVVDLILSTSLIPGMIKTYLFKDNFVPFKLCLVQMYFYYTPLCLESFSLAVLAFDRFIAICFPLRQNSINTNITMVSILTVCWSFCIGMVMYSVYIMKYLSFCGSVLVNSYFCDYAPVFRLACNDNSMQWATATSLSLIILFGPLSLIIISYVSILIAVFKMKSVESRFKALATCTEHLILVAVFYIPILTIFIIGFFWHGVNSDLRVLSLSLSSCIPPCLNPIIYSLKTSEIRRQASFLLRKSIFGTLWKTVHPF